MADLGNVLSAATEYGNVREAEGRAEQREADAADLAAANARVVEAEAARDEARRDAADISENYDLLHADWEALKAEFDEYKRTHPDEPTDPEDPAPEPTPTLAEIVQGTWVLQQVSSTAELGRLRNQIDAALALPGVVGLCIRAPWNAADDLAIFNAGLAIARDAGKEFAPRFMAGRHTPARVFDNGAAHLIFNGQRAPVPWDNSTGRVQVFLDAYDEYVGRLAAWCRANDVHLLHGSWYALDWAELNHGKEIRAASGYTEAKWLAGHKALISVLASHSSADLAVELPMSGYGPLSGGQSAALTDHVIAVRKAPDQFFIQANGWGPNGEWGAPSQDVERQFDAIWEKPVMRGLQMIQPQDYDWAPVFARLTANDATYAEVYLPSFTLAHAPQLRAEIATFKEGAE